MYAKAFRSLEFRLFYQNPYACFFCPVHATFCARYHHVHKVQTIHNVSEDGWVNRFGLWIISLRGILHWIGSACIHYMYQCHISNTYYSTSLTIGISGNNDLWRHKRLRWRYLFQLGLVGETHTHMLNQARTSMAGKVFIVQKKSCPTSSYSSQISVLFPWHVFHIFKYVSVRGVSVAVNEVFVHMDTHLSYRWICTSAMARIPQLAGFIPAKT